jgi:hypothetical protein
MVDLMTGHSPKFCKTQPSGLLVLSEPVELRKSCESSRFLALNKQEAGGHAQYVVASDDTLLQSLIMPCIVERVQKVHGFET